MATLIKYDSEPCTRCGGTGQHSYNPMDGTRCFKCRGSGLQLTKRGKAAKAFADNLLDVPVEKAGERTFQFTGFARRYNGCTAELERSDDIKTRYFQIMSRSGEIICCAGEGIRVRLHPTPQEVEEILAYQDSLTKAGKPRKCPAR